MSLVPIILSAQANITSGDCNDGLGPFHLLSCETMMENCRQENKHPILTPMGAFTNASVECVQPPPPPPPPGKFTPLVNIGIDPELGFGAYINAVYLLSISIAALLAVIKIIVAGVKWMLTDLVNAKGEAKKDIQGALLGLLIIISAHVILTTVNPELIEFKMLPPTEVTTP